MFSIHASTQRLTVTVLCLSVALLASASAFAQVYVADDSNPS
jgi:hypothetical protein